MIVQATVVVEVAASRHICKVFTNLLDATYEKKLTLRNI